MREKWTFQTKILSHHKWDMLVDSIVAWPWTMSSWVWPTTKTDISGAFYQHLQLGCCWQLVALSTLPAPSSSSRSFRSHFSLQLLSLFLYHCLIHSATSGPSVGLSATLQHSQEMSRNTDESGVDTGKSAHARFNVSCDFECSALMRLCASPTIHTSEETVYGGERGGGEGPRVCKFMMKRRNPLLRDFHTVARLRVWSQPPTVTLHVCVYASLASACALVKTDAWRPFEKHNKCGVVFFFCMKRHKGILGM